MDFLHINSLKRAVSAFSKERCWFINLTEIEARKLKPLLNSLKKKGICFLPKFVQAIWLSFQIFTAHGNIQTWNLCAGVIYKWIKRKSFDMLAENETTPICRRGCLYSCVSYVGSSVIPNIALQKIRHNRFLVLHV